jgi:hypothetical protein
MSDDFTLFSEIMPALMSEATDPIRIDFADVRS